MPMNRKEQLKEVFEDTQRFYEENTVLKEAVETNRNNTKLYEADDYPDLPILGTVESLWAMAENPDGSLYAQSAAYAAMKEIEKGAPNDPIQHNQEVRITKHKTFEAAMALHKEFPDKKIAVLNFASATRPGGGVKIGSSAQEESLCRCSTLYPTIDRRWLWQKYYDVNRVANDVIHTDACIYSPGVIICKTDESIPQRMPENEFVTIDVITCAAPNLRNEPANWHNPETGKPIRMDSNQLYEIHLKRAQHIFHIAAANKVDILILGAFGCGAFRNDPAVVAQAYRIAIIPYKARFDLIEFAIYCRDYEIENYDAFYKEFWMLTKDGKQPKARI